MWLTEHGACQMGRVLCRCDRRVCNPTAPTLPSRPSPAPRVPHTDADMPDTAGGDEFGSCFPDYADGHVRSSVSFLAPPKVTTDCIFRSDDAGIAAALQECEGFAFWTLSQLLKYTTTTLPSTRYLSTLPHRLDRRLVRAIFSGSLALQRVSLGAIFKALQSNPVWRTRAAAATLVWVLASSPECAPRHHAGPT
jgi:hypothetical protein